MTKEASVPRRPGLGRGVRTGGGAEVEEGEAEVCGS